MGFKKDLKRAERWLSDYWTDDDDYYAAEEISGQHADQFCWDLIQRLDAERKNWRQAARDYDDGFQKACWTVQDHLRTIGNLQRKVEALAAEAAHWKTKAEEADRGYYIVGGI